MITRTAAGFYEIQDRRFIEDAPKELLWYAVAGQFLDADRTQVRFELEMTLWYSD